MDYTTPVTTTSCQPSQLSKPLLGLEDVDLDETEVSYDGYDEEVALCYDADCDCCELHSTTCCDNFILWLVLPVLLFVQFGIAFRLDQQQLQQQPNNNNNNDHQQHSSSYYALHNLDWTTVNYSILLFVLSSYLFRRTLQETCTCCCQNNNASGGRMVCSTVGFLLPEIIMDLLLALVLFGQVVPAFLTMVLSTMALSLYVVVQSLQTLMRHHNNNNSMTEVVEITDEPSQPLVV